MSQPFRFVHASDFHLERPLAGLADTPAHLAELFLDAPYRAAERVFEATINERADFLVLAGDILHVERAGPRALAFLTDQFERLAARGIAVYWAGGLAEWRGPWPDDLKLPDNVKLFPPGAPQALAHHADGDLLAVLLGRSVRGRDEKSPVDRFTRQKGAPCTIGVVYGPLANSRLAKAGVDYWACGGEHNRRRLAAARQTAIYSGAPQGRLPAERGRHGAVVVDVDDHATFQPRFVATDVARFGRVRLVLDAAAPASEQERALAAAVEIEQTRAGSNDLFLQWQVKLRGAPHSRAAREAWASERLAWLRREFGKQSPTAWSISLSVQAPRGTVVPAERDSLLAEFLAAVDTAATRSDKLPLESLLPEALRGGALAELLSTSDPADRRRILRAAAALGRELLGAEEDVSA